MIRPRPSFASRDNDEGKEAYTKKTPLVLLQLAAKSASSPK
jgi:hypothetical protein